MRIAIVTDCWLPQIDGIVRTLEPTVRELRKLGHDVLLLTPLDFLSVPLPYGDRLVLPSYLKLSRRLGAFGPNTVHLATQGSWGSPRWPGANAIGLTTLRLFIRAFPSTPRFAMVCLSGCSTATHAFSMAKRPLCSCRRALLPII